MQMPRLRGRLRRKQKIKQHGRMARRPPERKSTPALQRGDITTEESFQDVETIESVNEYYTRANLVDRARRARANAAALPSKVDNSQSKYFPAIGNQGSIGSCTAWSQVYYQFTYAMNKSMGRETTTATTFSPKWAYNLVNSGMDKGTSAYEIYAVLKLQGAALWSQVPYDSDYLSWSPEKDIWSSAGDYRISGYQRLTFGEGDTPITGPGDQDLELIKTALNNGELLAYSTYISSWEYETLQINPAAPENTVYADESIVIAQNGRKGSHRMTIVGYNDDLWADINGDGQVQEQEKGAFKIVNSWGDDFENDGFVWVSYDALNEISSVPGAENAADRQGIFCDITRIDVAPYDSDSDILLTYTLNSEDRNQTRVYVTAEKFGTKTTKEVSPYSISLLDEYGKYSYDGAKNANDGTMCLDLEEVIEGLNSDNFQDYTWSVEFVDEEKDGKVSTVKDAKIVDRNTGNVYTRQESYPFTLDGSSKTLEMYACRIRAAVIYYRGYENPYIFYKIGDGDWTPGYGVAMEANTEKYGFLYKYVILLGDTSEGATVCFNDGEENWDTNNGQYYTAQNGINTFITQNTVPELKITSFTTANSDQQVEVNATYQTLAVFLQAEGGYAPYTYSFSCAHQEISDDQYTTGYSESSTGHLFVRNPGTYCVTGYVKDRSGRVLTSVLYVTAVEEDFTIRSFTTDPESPVALGNKITFTVSTAGENVYPYSKDIYTWTIQKDGQAVANPKTTEITEKNVGQKTSTAKMEWTPTETGQYIATVRAVDYKNNVAEKSVAFTVSEEMHVESLTADPKSPVKIGEEITFTAITNGDGISAYYPYHKVESSWTVKKDGQVVASPETSYFNRIAYRSSQLQAKWTPDEAGNYAVTVQVEDIEGNFAEKTSWFIVEDALCIDSFTTDLDNYMGIYGTVNMRAQAAGGMAPYQYQFSYWKTGSNTVIQPYSDQNTASVQFKEAGTYRLLVSVKDAKGNVATEKKTFTVANLYVMQLNASKTDAQAGETVTFRAETSNEAKDITYSNYYYTVTKDGKTQSLTTNTDKTANWAPPEAGTYTVRLEIRYDEKVLSFKTMEYTVSPPSNRITIYYKGYSTPYIHYQIGEGSWTNVPGIAMEESAAMPGYTHQYTIELGDAAYANVCFNDGHNNWDSRNGQNYRFEAGTYTYQNGQMVKIG